MMEINLYNKKTYEYNCVYKHNFVIILIPSKLPSKPNAIAYAYTTFDPVPFALLLVEHPPAVVC